MTYAVGAHRRNLMIGRLPFAVVAMKLCFTVMVLLVNVTTNAHADFKPVQYHDGETLELDVRVQPDVVDLAEQAPDWEVEIRREAVVEVVNRTDSSGFCVRLAFGHPNAMYTRVSDSPVHFQGGNARGNASCSDEPLVQPVFHLAVEVPTRTRRYLGIGDSVPSVRILMNVPGDTGSNVALRDFQWALEARTLDGDWVLIGGLNLGSAYSESRWFHLGGSKQRYMLVLVGEEGVDSPVVASAGGQKRIKPRTTVTPVSGPVEIQYGVRDGVEAPEDALSINGKTWHLWQKVPLAEQATVSWDYPRYSPRSLQLCEDNSCEILIKELPVSKTPLQIKRADLPHSEKIYLIADWQSGSSDSFGDSGGTEVAITLSPQLAYDAYSKPLTSCLASFDSMENSTRFRLRQGYQELTEDSVPSGLAPDALVRIVFNRSRNGDECPVKGLSFEATSLSKLRGSDSANPLEVKIGTSENLFVGYLQLNAADYRDSLARWRETIGFFNRVYVQGRGSLSWMDGLMFGAGERGGLDLKIEPNSNFSSVLGDESTLLDVAKAMQSDKRVSSNFFLEQLISIKERIGDASVSLLYFDDFPGGCGTYVSDVAESGLNVKSALVVSAVANNTDASNSIRSIGSGIAYLCEVSENVHAYAFNWNERLLNLDWDSTLEVIMNDWFQVGVK